MRCLADSQVVLWTMTPSACLSARASAAIADASNTIFVSAATPYELEWKKAIGKLQFPHVPDWAQAMQSAGYQELPIALRHGQRAALLPMHHRDPWDRILVAQALVEGMVLITSDANLAAYGVPTLW